jgi:hypothetical protein
MRGRGNNEKKGKGQKEWGCGRERSRNEDKRTAIRKNKKIVKS